MTFKKEKLKNIGLWFSLVSVVYLMLGVFGIDLAPDKFETVVNIIAALLTSLGIVSNPSQGKFYIDR